MNTEKIIRVARVGAPFGVRGYLKFHIFLENPELIFQFKEFYLRFPHQVWQLAPQFKFDRKGDALYIQFEGFDQREAAALRFTNAEFGVDRSLLPALKQNEYYWDDLIGLKVVNQQYQELGVVDHLLETGANDVLVVKNAKGDELLIPYVWKHFVISVDLEKSLMMVDWDV